MTEKLEVIVAGVTYDLSDKVTYWHMRSKGFGLADSKRLMLQGPLQHGASDVGYRLQPRKLQLVLLFSKDSEAAYWSGRDALLRLFRPSDALLKLKFTAGTIVRQIDCAPISVDLDSGDRKLYDHIVPVELMAPDPSWYDPDGVSVGFGLSGGTTAMPVPMLIPMTVGASALDETLPVAYVGSWDSYPIVTVIGPVTNLILTNLATGDKLDFTGTTIASGNSYVIDCRYGYKTVTKQSDSSNRIQDLTADSDLATFRIASPPDVPDGVNTIKAQGSTIDANTHIYVQFYSRFIGI